MSRPKYRQAQSSEEELMDFEGMNGEHTSQDASHNNRTHFRGNEQRMGGRYSDIACRSFILIVPMLAFVGILLGLIFHNRVQSGDIPFEHLRLPDQQDAKGVYYVDINLTLLVFFASLSSSVAPALAGFAIALIAYPAARTYLREGRAGGPSKLLTPYQLFLTLQLLDGGVYSGLWSWIRYVFSFKHRRPLASPLRSTLSVAVLAMILAIAVFASSLWLHITTKSVNLELITLVTTGADYSLALWPGCTRTNNSLAAQPEILFSAVGGNCSLNLGGTATFLENAAQSVEVLNNMSDAIAAFQYEVTPYVYLGVPPSTIVSKRDYTATTYGIQTQCKPISKQCSLREYDGSSTPFSCSDAFSGDVSQAPNGWIETYFTDATMTSNNTNRGIHNPYSFGIAAALPSVAQVGQVNATYDPETVIPLHGGIAFVLNCSTALYDIQYDSINGNVSRFVTVPSNDSVANIWQGVREFPTTDIALPNLLQAAFLATFSGTAQEIADKIALAYSRVVLAVGSEVLVPQPALAAQEREDILVARVPKAPLFAMVSASLLFVVMGIILTCIALLSSGGEVREIQVRLSILGLVADRFESARGRNGVGMMEQYFEEREGPRTIHVGLDYAEDSGYTYKVLKPGST